MKETQHIEWKESWRDDYLKWICGFANAEGGVLVIGRNDKGIAVGVKVPGNRWRIFRTRFVIFSASWWM
jgi:ATP-dependent DNA helicase RecG